MQRSISIILCTCNRPDDLRATLQSIVSAHAAHAELGELLVIDNSPSGTAAAVANKGECPAFQVRYFHEPRRGKGYAYNAGLAAATGDVLVFTDDDVRVPPDWALRMADPIRSGRADAVAGGVRLAPHLNRPWMTTMHRAIVADTAWLDRDRPQAMVGANMAFARRVLEKVPAFDVELGPGALGLYDETLFTWQLLEAGYRLVPALDIEVEHHFHSGRLSPAGFRAAAAKIGRSLAYVVRHWEHGEQQNLWHRLARGLLLRTYWRLKRRGFAGFGREAVPDWDLHLTRDINFVLQYARERKREPNYAPRGLLRQAASGAGAGSCPVPAHVDGSQYTVARTGSEA